MPGLNIDEQRGNHADNLLPADVANGSLGDEELLERCERREFTDDILRGSHLPGELLGEPFELGWGLDKLTVEGHLGDFRDVMVDEALLHGKGMAGQVREIF